MCAALETVSLLKQYCKLFDNFKNNVTRLKTKVDHTQHELFKFHQYGHNDVPRLVNIVKKLGNLHGLPFTTG